MDNERPIEKLLRAFARKRRDAAPDPAGLELHPATRRMLQGEVARQYPRQPPAGTPWADVWVRLWPRLAWAVPVLVVLGLGAWALVYSGKQTSERRELAKNTPKPAETPAVASAEFDKAKTAVAEREASNAMAISRMDSLKTELKPATPTPAKVAERAEGAPTATIAAAPPSVPPPAALPSDNRGLVAAANQPKVGTGVSGGGFAGGARGGRGGGGGYGGSPVGGGGPGMPATANAPTINATKPAAGNVAAIAGAQYSQAFNNIAVANTEQLTQRFAQALSGVQGVGGFKAPPASQVLNNFQVEQNGNQLRVIDDDGSTYTGLIETAAAEDSNTRQVLNQTQTAKFKEAAPVGPSKVGAQQLATDQAMNFQNAQNYAFRVSGFNNTVRQPVVFTGNLVALTNAPIVAQKAGNIAGFDSNQVQQAQQVQPLLQNSSMNGTAQIGDKQQIPINAVPVQQQH